MVESSVTQQDIYESIRSIGLKTGQTVLVHSSLSAFGHVDGGANAVIDALRKSVGSEGLLSMPTHTWDTVNVRQPVFHAELSPSIVGSITEQFRTRAGTVRSLHPTHSVAAVGMRANEFIAGHELWSTPCSFDSPYGRLVQWGGYVLLLGVGLDVCTLIHGFEEWAQVSWLFNREETLYTVRHTDQVLRIPSRRHTNELGYDRDYPALEQYFERNGIIRYGSVGNATIRLLDARAMWEVMEPLLRQHPDAILVNGYRGFL